MTDSGQAGAGDAPQSPLEGTLALIWQQALGVAAVPRDAEFFALGGDSLAAIRMLADVEELLRTHVSFTDFIEAPTLADLALAVERVRRGEDEPAGRPAGAGADGAAEAPCTFAQERLWFMDQTGAGAAYNLPLCSRLTGPLDAAALERALLEVVARHAALRTSFVVRDGVPAQLVAPGSSLRLEREDLAGEPDPEAAARRRAEELLAEPFDLEHGPLLRASLLRLGDDDHVLALAFHHIICDGWSHAVLFDELGRLYEDLAGGREPGLPAPAVQYPDHARRQRERPAHELDAQRRWWQEALAGSPAALELPTDRPRPAVLSQRGATLRSSIGPEANAAIRELARAHGVTTFAVLLSVYAVLLSRYSGQKSVVIGSTAAGRDGPGLDGAVGFFANTIALRAELGDDPAFSELVRRMAGVLRDGVVHQDVPFEWVVADLEGERDAGRHPVFQVFFAQTPPVTLGIGGAQPFPVSLPGARFELVLSVEEHAGGLALVWEYSTDLFAPETIERYAEHYGRLLEAATSSVDVAVSQLPMLSEGERRGLIEMAAARAPEQPVACLHELFAAQAALAPDAPAVVHEGAMLTYRQLDVRANQLAHRLRALGVARGDLVALCLERSLDMVVAALAVLKAGGAYVPLDPEFPADRLTFVLDDTRAPVVLTQERLLDRLGGQTATAVLCLDLEAAALAGEPATAPDGAGAPEDLAYVIYTSGSTGRPKGVEVEHGNVARLFSSTQGWFGFGPSDTWALLHSYAFDFSVWEMWGALLHGGKLVVPSHWTIRSPEALARMLAGERVTVLNATPSLFSSVMDELLAVAGHLALRVVVFGGEALRPAALARWFEHFGDAGPALVNMYGITETTVHVTYQRLDAAAVAASASPIGEPLPDLELHLLDERGEPVPVGVPGEIHVGGAGVARGYLNRPELTAERFVPNPFGPGRLYRSGDLARRLGTGALDFIGRADSQVKVRGYRIELGEIESTLLGHEAVSEAAVIATDVGPGDTRLAAYVVPKPGTREGDPRVALQAHLEERLPSYMVPASIIVLAALPRTPNGKLDPRALPAPTWQQAAEPGGGHVAPRTETEEAIAEVWQRVLGIDRVSSEDSFFALGGHSLLAARIATEVRRRFAIELSVRALFDHPTLAGFAESVDAARAPAPAGEPSQEAGSERADEERHPLSSQQQQLLYFDALRPGTPVYNAALAVAVDGPLDVDALRCALDGVIARHEPLRTVFAWEQGEPVQRVLSEWATDLTVVEVADGDAASEELRRLQHQHARRPFDLATDATLRASVFRLGPRRHVVLLQPHHISVDGWSVDILFSELSELYEAERTGRPHTLAPLGRRYLDFARWQREQAGSPRREDDVGYWRRQLAGARDTPPLRPDRPRPAEQTFEGATLVVDFPPSLAEAVTEVARARQVTPYMVLLAAFGVLLQRSGGSDDILVGTPTANRGLAEFEPLIGYFANTLALRVRLGGNPTFSELLERVRSTTLEAIEHEELPFEQVVEAVGSRRDPAINPLFQVNFRARVDGPPQLRLGEASTHWSMADIGISRFDLALEVHVTEDGLECLFEHNTDLFDTATVEALARDYGAVLEHVAREPDSRLLAIPAGAQAESPGRPAGIRGFRGRSDSHSTAG